MKTVQIYNVRIDTWTLLPDHNAARELIDGKFYQHGSELLYFDKYGAIEVEMTTNTWFTDWPDGVPVAQYAFNNGKVVVYS